MTHSSQDAVTGTRGRSSASYQAWAAIIGLLPAALLVIFAQGLPVRHAAAAALVAGIFALAAALLRAVDWSGALAGFGVAFTLFYRGGLGMFAVLLVVFVATWLATRAGYARKQQRGLAESRRGRAASQVLANVGAAAFVLLVPLLWPAAAPLAACFAVAVLSEAAADTVSSELGQAFGRNTVLITTGRPVPPGTDGGLTYLGMWSALVAATLTAATAMLASVLPPIAALAAALAGVLGSHLDSVLGATLERRGVLGNDAVNLLSTLAAGTLAAGLYALLLAR